MLHNETVYEHRLKNKTEWGEGLTYQYSDGIANADSLMAVKCCDKSKTTHTSQCKKKIQ